MFFPITDCNVVKIFIPNDIISFNLFLFYLILWFCYTHDVVGKYVIKVLRCNWPYCVLADGIAIFIIYLFNYVIVIDVIVTGPDVIRPILFIVVIVVHDVIMEQCGCQVSHMSKAWVRASRTSAENMGLKCISRRQHHQGPPGTP